MTTWREVLEERGADLRKIKRELQKVQSGCVIRALESITGAQATEGEWDLRLGQLNSGPSFFELVDEIGGNGSLLVTAILGEIENDLQQVEDLVVQMSGTDSPMGSKLKGTKVHFDRLTPPEMKTAITAGNELMFAGASRNTRGGIGMHALHLGIDSHGRFISKSDSGNPIVVDDEDRYRVLVFTNLF